jgi:hypothetical protein
VLNAVSITVVIYRSTFILEYPAKGLSIAETAMGSNPAGPNPTLRIQLVRAAALMLLLSSAVN